MARYEVQYLNGKIWKTLNDQVKGNRFVDNSGGAVRTYLVRALSEAIIPGPWSRSASRGRVSAGCAAGEVVASREPSSDDGGSPPQLLLGAVFAQRDRRLEQHLPEQQSLRAELHQDRGAQWGDPLLPGRGLPGRAGRLIGPFGGDDGVRCTGRAEPQRQPGQPGLRRRRCPRHPP